MLNDRRRNDDDISAHVYFDPNVNKLAGPQCFLLVIKYCFISNGACCRVDLIVDHRECASCQRHAFTILHRDRDFAVFQLSADLRKGFRRQREIHEYRVQLIDDDNTGIVGRAHDVADIDYAGTGPSVDWRPN